jgi:cyclophilin family peptidyl-prolyl cis-trans isomerase/HEAT repeat protein
MSPIRHRPQVRVSSALTLASLALLAGCAGQGAAPQSGPTVGDGLEERAILLLLEDRETFDADGIALALVAGAKDERLRARAALTLARLADKQGAPFAERLAGDSAAEVRANALFALGEIAEAGVASVRPTIVRSLLDPERQVGIVAVEAAAKAGIPLEEVVARLIEGSSQELLPRLLPSLFRFEGEGVVRWATLALETKDKALRAQGAYALARNPLPAGLADLRLLTTEGDPWLRSLAARGLGRVGHVEDLPLLRRLLDDAEPGPVIQALRAWQRLEQDGKLQAVPPDVLEHWQRQALALTSDARAGVRIAALEVIVSFLPDAALAERLAALSASELPRERELALLALAVAGDPRAPAALARLAADPMPAVRAAAARAAGFLADGATLTLLAEDASANVRRAVLEVRLAPADATAVDAARAALGDPDFAIRSLALDHLTEHAGADLETLGPALITATDDVEADAQVSAVRALAALVQRDAAARDRALSLLEPMAKRGQFLVRRAAIAALRQLGEAPPPLGPALVRDLQVYRDLDQLSAAKRKLAVITERGSFDIELACADAPRTCSNFLNLAGQRFFDGLLFHRVVPDFVAQAGDPRGDGVGGPGYTLRDELNRLPFDAYVLGMAHGGPDTAGSQFFVTLTPQPHLEGGYTVFGRVVAGFEVLPQLVQGDRILRVELYR